jgi:hypothetical protein
MVYSIFGQVSAEGIDAQLVKRIYHVALAAAKIKD